MDMAEGWWEWVWSHEHADSSDSQDHPSEYQSEEKQALYFLKLWYFHGILQKWYLNNRVIKSCLDKNGFHIQFHTVGTFQNLLAHVNYFADLEKMDSDGKLHA